MKKLCLVATLFILSTSLFAQSEESKGFFNKDKLFGGGNFGVSLGRFTLINLSPQLGYRFNKHFASGLGINFIYASVKERDYYGDFSKTSQGITGLNLFGRYYPIDNFMVQIQPEVNYTFGNITYYRTPDNQPTNQKYKLDAEIVPSFLAGGGLVLPSGRNALIISVMYDFMQRPNSPYGNRPITNIGYNFSF